MVAPEKIFAVLSLSIKEITHGLVDVMQLPIMVLIMDIIRLMHLHELLLIRVHHVRVPEMRLP